MVFITSYSQYKNDFFNKLNFNFQKGKKILDMGCGPGTDASIFINIYELKYYGVDVYEDENILKQKLEFKRGTILRIPFKNNFFDYVFVHDVLHHIDEPNHRKKKHIGALKELSRVCKLGGFIIIVEGNRYNPLFYPHMVKMRKHEHFSQQYFISIIREAYIGYQIELKFFEAHLYPKLLLPFFKLYEFSMEHFSPKQFLAYNAAIIKKR